MSLLGRAKEKVARGTVAPLRPFRYTWEGVSALGEKGLPIDAIESVGEIDFDKDCTASVAVSAAPLTRH